MGYARAGLLGSDRPRSDLLPLFSFLGPFGLAMGFSIRILEADQTRGSSASLRPKMHRRSKACNRCKKCCARRVMRVHGCFRHETALAMSVPLATWSGSGLGRAVLLPGWHPHRVLRYGLAHRAPHQRLRPTPSAFRSTFGPAPHGGTRLQSDAQWWAMKHAP